LTEPFCPRGVRVAETEPETGTSMSEQRELERGEFVIHMSFVVRVWQCMRKASGID